MKILALVACLLVQSSWANLTSVVPERVITPLVELYDEDNTEAGDTFVEMKKLSVDEEGEIWPSSETHQITKELFDLLHGWAGPVYETLNVRNEATAVHIGHNLVLTNHHVLTNGEAFPENCMSFRVKEKNSPYLFGCHKVHFCSKQDDLCLVEMEPLQKTRRACVTCRKETVTISLAKGPMAKLASTLAYDDTAVTTAIGNTLGLGLHASQGIGLRYFHPDIFFYAPTTTGNSGGALYAQNGLMIGIVKSGTVLKISPDPIMAFNTAISSVRIIELIREALKNDPVTLKKFEEAIR